MLTFKQFLVEVAKPYSDTKAHDTFMYGHCRSFAHALHKRIGGEVKSLHKDGKELHVFVHKAGKNYDVGGKRSHAQMIMNVDGSLDHAHKWSEHIVDHSTMKTNPKMVDNAEKYISANPHKFRE